MDNEWFSQIEEWMELNSVHRTNNIPDKNEEYFLYQSMIGNYPLADEEDWLDRFRKYIIKCLRESKIHSSWNDPDEEYENNVLKFIDLITNKENPFWKSFINFINKISDPGIINSLSQLLLKMT